MKRSWGLAALGAIIVIIALILSGCGGSPVMSTPKSLTEKSVRLSDGREIACVVYVEYNVTCDWDHPLSNINGTWEDEQ